MKTARNFEALMKELFAKHGLSFEKTGSWLNLKPDTESFMPLNIERIVPDFVAVSHTYVQNGDLMRDPEVVFWTQPSGWFPIEYRQDGLGIHQIIGEVDGTKLRYAPGRYASLLDFVENTWAFNIREQGYLDLEANEAQEGDIDM